MSTSITISGTRAVADGHMAPAAADRTWRRRSASHWARLVWRARAHRGRPTADTRVGTPPDADGLTTARLREALAMGIWFAR